MIGVRMMRLRLWMWLIAAALLAAWPALALDGGEPLAQRPLISGRHIDSAKSAIAVAGLLVLASGALLASRAFLRGRDGLLAVLGVAGALAGWNFLQFHNPGFLHPSDAYHYFVGAKYFRELGYTRLYHCATLADQRAGLTSRLAGARVRDLETNAIVDVEEILTNPNRCTQHFTPARWAQFQRDVAWFRARHTPTQWRRVRQDHGYNATPAWTIAGWLLTNFDSHGPPGPRVALLAGIDPLLLSITWGCVAWAFGWRSMCMALIFWGTFQTAAFHWTGGSILRQGWFASLVIGICFVHKRRPALGGSLLAVSALLRIFPAVAFVGIGLKALWSLRGPDGWTVSREHRRIAFGAAAAVGIALPASMWIADDPAVWSQFARNSQVHLSTPLRNHLGLRTLLSYDHETRSAVSRDHRAQDPYAVWKQGRRDAFAGRQPLFWGIVLGYTGLLAWAVRGRDDAVAAIAAVGTIPIAFELTGYYYSVLAVFAFVGRTGLRMGASLCGLSALSWLSVEIWHSRDESYTWTSLLCVIFAIGSAVAIAHTGPAIRERTDSR